MRTLLPTLRHKVPLGMGMACALWLTMVGAATIGMSRYSNSPGDSGAPPVLWPKESALPLRANRPTLLLFAHPHCPCTRASLGELETLLAQVPSHLNVHIVFLKPSNTPANWDKSDLWRTASNLPGVTVHTDENGIETRRFHSETSGQTLLYDAKGKLLFEGGITSARGHAGDNPGRSALQELLRDGNFRPTKMPVFGCRLIEPGCEKGEALCKP